MLQSIHVKNMALIDEAEVHFGEHLNILTGETGAGKSIIIGSVGMALGGKASKEMIRRGESYALVELDFVVKDPEIRQSLEALELSVEDEHILISRKISGSRSVARINGEVVSLAVLRQAASMLIDIHGQHEHQSLLHHEKHLEILDLFSREELGQSLQSLAERYHEYTKIRREMDSAVTDEGKRKSEISFLEYQINEIDEASLTPGEEEILDKVFRKMSHARQMIESVSDAHEMTGYDSSHAAGDLIGRALRELYPIEKYDEAVSGLIAQLSDIDALLNDFNRELADYQDSLTFDEETYRETESRIDLIQRLENKYGSDIEQVLLYRDRCEKQLEKLKNYESYLLDLKHRYKMAEKALLEVSEQVSQIRKKNALRLQKEITEALRDLNFLDVSFEIRCDRLPGYTADGIDRIEFLISTNPGEPVQPLGKVASGGELSRIMLAIKSVLADADAIETLIFDEIDTGISGRTAQKVSEKMAVIAGKHQVICITHLPQIAAMADTHFVIEKRTEDQRTRTQIHVLDKDEEIHEIARLLGGVEITGAVIENAREMKMLAGAIKH